MPTTAPERTPARAVHSAPLSASTTRARIAERPDGGVRPEDYAEEYVRRARAGWVEDVWIAYKRRPRA
jgi:hypothetical protein